MFFLISYARSFKGEDEQISQYTKQGKMDQFVNIPSLKPGIHFWQIITGKTDQDQYKKKPGNAWYEFFKRDILHVANFKCQMQSVKLTDQSSVSITVQ